MRPVLILTSLAVLAAPVLPPVAHAAPAAAEPSAGATTPGWPHTIEGKDGSVTVYPPQVTAWPNRTTLEARMAVALQRRGSTVPVLGTLEISGRTETDQGNRTVTMSGIRLVSSHFPSLDTGQAQSLAERIQAALDRMPPKTVPLDMVLMSLAQAPVDARPVPVNNAPPAIYVSATPASLVVFDGEPVMVPVQGSPLTRAVNTNWPVFQDPESHAWYLLNNGAWFSAAAAAGPWAPTTSLPAAFRALATNPDFPELKGSVPGHAPNPVPQIIVSTRPAEIIVTDGPPKWTPVPQTTLQVAANTDAALFKDTSGTVYYLVSGRWFAAPGLDGPWRFASDSLPPDFAMIPAETPQGQVLASVPGTQQSQEALIQAQIPTQATLDRKTTTIKVAYAGPPQFKPVPGTSVSAAANTNYPVFQVGGAYYACWQGAWFTAPSPTGPWVLAASVPPAIYEIPPSSPYYPVTYVSVYSATAGGGDLWLHRRLRAGLHHRRPAGVRHRLLLSAVYRAGADTGVLPVPLLLCRRRLLQCGDRRLGTRRRRVRPVLRGPRRRLLQSRHGRVGAGRRGLRTLWRCRRLVGLQSRHRALFAWLRLLGTLWRHRECQLL